MENKKRQRILVTGGAGFIGSHVVQELIAQQHDVLVVDDLVYFEPKVTERHLKNVAKRLSYIEDKANVVRGNISDKDAISRIFEAFQPTLVIHLAAMPIAKHALTAPTEASDSILHGTINVLEASRAAKSVQRMVYVSSSMVYGNFETDAITEDHPKRPLEVYGALKLAGEDITRILSNRYGFDYSIIRPTAVYGPTDNTVRVIGIFLDKARMGQPLEVRGVNSSLDFTFVTDTAQGVVNVALHPDASQKAFNISRGRGRTILEAAETIASLIPNTQIELVGVDEDLPMRGTMSIAKASDIVGYRPVVDLEEGIERYLRYLEASDKERKELCHEESTSKPQFHFTD